MKIQDLFDRDIHRSINGVVKADQLDASSVWQELDEFVVTKELVRHLTDLIEVLLSTMQSTVDAADKNGIWVSGFFGCGKSHLIKVLSYLLENGEHEFGGNKKRAADFFQDKLSDPMLFADLKRVVGSPTDTILFNIDSKADHRGGRDALLQVFLKVLNEKQGYSSDHPHIAHLERHLEDTGKLDIFRAAFEKAAGASWQESRDAWEFHRDEVGQALTEALGQSQASAEAWIEGSESNFSLTVENLAKWVKRYLDSKGPDHRIMFLVDEVGQFIGNDTHMMLNLQTITEQLGTVCAGRAWVVVTSQEDLDAVLGEIRHGNQHDFSKIQGRFKTRLSLSSGNVDEVIKRRLLDKKPEANAPLSAAYEGKHDILRNQLSFMHAGMSFKNYADEADFAACYPFAAYQFTLVQKVFESIRKAGATGLHLSQGERSTLDAFQNAAKHIGGKEIGALVPFYDFYPSVEGFLDTAVKRTIDQAGENHALEPFDGIVLKVLFLIRYIEELPGNVDNLVTLCVDEIDTDKLALRRKIEKSLANLEGETLVARNGDLYFFLTNEERDIGREIKGQPIPSGSEERELGKLLFEEVLGDMRKYTYTATGRNFNFSRLCDDHPVGNRLEGSLEVAFITPLGDSYLEFKDDHVCVNHHMSHSNRLLIRMPDDLSLGSELRTFLQTSSYVNAKQTSTLPDTTKRILRDRIEDNRERRKRLVISIKEMLPQASYFASGKKLENKSSDPKQALGEALEYLIQNEYPKMGYIQHPSSNPKQELQSILRANDVDQIKLIEDDQGPNIQALEDMREYIRMCTLTSKPIVLHEMVEKRYGQQPYGWLELEVLLLVARLAVSKEISLVVDSHALPMEQAYDYFTSTNKQRKVVITQRQVADSDVIKEAQKLGKELFGKQGPATEDSLFTFLKGHVSDWASSLSGFLPLAQTGDYPGLDEIESSLQVLTKFTKEPDSLKFLKRLVENRTELLEVSDHFGDLHGFYTNQRTAWDALRSGVQAFGQNRLQIDSDPTAGPALARMEEILAAKHPYELLPEAAELTHTVQAANDTLVSAARQPAMAEIQRCLDGVETELGKASADSALRSKATAGLQKLLETAATSDVSIAHIAQAAQAATTAFDQAMLAIESSLAPAVDGTAVSEAPPVPAPKKRRVVSVRAIWTDGFLEDQADVDAFLEKLRQELVAGINAGERIQIG